MILDCKQRTILEKAFSSFESKTSSQVSPELQSDLVNVVFNETLHGMRFTPFVMEVIKRTHKTLSYNMRQQYPKAKNVFDAILQMPASCTTKEQCAKYCFGFWDRLNNLTPELVSALIVYYEAMCKDVIDTIVFSRFGYYSPSMVLALFYSLLLYLGETYVNEQYGLVLKHFVRDKYPTTMLSSLVNAVATCDGGTRTSRMHRDIALFYIEQDAWQKRSE